MAGIGTILAAMLPYCTAYSSAGPSCLVWVYAGIPLDPAPAPSIPEPTCLSAASFSVRRKLVLGLTRRACRRRCPASMGSRSTPWPPRPLRTTCPGAAEVRQQHEIDVLDLGVRLQVVTQAPKDGGLDSGLLVVSHGLSRRLIGAFARTR